MSEVKTNVWELTWQEKAKAYFELLKHRLSTFVALSGTFGYYLAVDQVEWMHLLLITLAGFGITGAANIINQIYEKDSDLLMKRTRNRPIPSGRLSVTEATVFCLILLAGSLFLFVHFFNFRSAIVALLSVILYGFVYTPLKRSGPIAVFVGAIPGAFPPMIGWVAATNQFGWEPGVLFAIQFFWQFPHFWALAWMIDDDYRQAGIRLLPYNGNKGLKTARAIMLYTVFLVPLGWIPYEMGITGITSAILATLGGVLLLGHTFYLMREISDAAARRLFFVAIAYLPILQIVFLLDKA
ncbi:heme o synthase [Siphonobacter aquaeclarae]|jgi:protoheme IX farnesyltransferase|uniref:Protoheme IX farnesyltransferase n=1 Tax=Siphonobacter aquaeclarae TaxID=563176 RepID=A0A1G9VJ71_9BACT|nr:heme o synthase [Siphonobacter aquaeclarae]MBO9638092.1 heme o synthase [Siphonobacter aquaeclarae]SDM72272.1 protoheme IX farnesyltransferase [Siphonobacter aquaeclarae]